MGLLNTLQTEANAGFPHLKGTRVKATVPIPQNLANEAITGHGIVGLQFRNANKLRASIFGLPFFTAEILRVEPPHVVVLGASFIARKSLLAFRGRLPYITVRGTELVVDVSSIPQLGAFRQFLRFFKIEDVRSQSGSLTVSLQLEIV